MPPRSVTIDIRDAAQQKIKAAAAMLSDRFGIAFAPAAAEGRDLDYLRARELESIAGFMDALANEPESDEAKTLKVKLAQAEKQIENLTGEAVLLRAEIENLTAAWQGAETKLAEAGLPTSADAVPEFPPAVASDHVSSLLPVTKADIDRLNRERLNEYAASLGIADVESFATKAALIAAIEALPK